MTIKVDDGFLFEKPEPVVPQHYVPLSRAELSERYPAANLKEPIDEERMAKLKRHAR